MEYNKEKLIVLVKLRPALYDNKSPHYWDKTYSITAWEQIGRECGNITAKKAKEIWRGLRDTYVRKRKEMANQNLSGIPTSPTWPYFSVMSFLDDYTKHHWPELQAILTPEAYSAICGPSECEDSSTCGEVSTSDHADDGVTTSGHNICNEESAVSGINVLSSTSTPMSTYSVKRKRNKEQDSLAVSSLVARKRKRNAVKQEVLEGYDDTYQDPNAMFHGLMNESSMIGGAAFHYGQIVTERLNALQSKMHSAYSEINDILQKYEAAQL